MGLYVSCRDAIYGSFSPTAARLRFIVGNLIEWFFKDSDIELAFKEISSQIRSMLKGTIDSSKISLNTKALNVIQDFNFALAMDFSPEDLPLCVEKVIDEKLPLLEKIWPDVTFEKAVGLLQHCSVLMKITFPLLSLFDLPTYLLFYRMKYDDCLFNRIRRFRNWYNNLFRFENVIRDKSEQERFYQKNKDTIFFFIQDYEPSSLLLSVVKLASDIHKWAYHLGIEDFSESVKICITRENPKIKNLMDAWKKRAVGNIRDYFQFDETSIFLPGILPYYPVYLKFEESEIKEDAMITYNRILDLSSKLFPEIEKIVSFYFERETLQAFYHWYLYYTKGEEVIGFTLFPRANIEEKEEEKKEDRIKKVTQKIKETVNNLTFHIVDTSMALAIAYSHAKECGDVLSFIRSCNDVLFMKVWDFFKTTFKDFSDPIFSKKNLTLTFSPSFKKLCEGIENYNNFPEDFSVLPFEEFLTYPFVDKIEEDTYCRYIEPLCKIHERMILSPFFVMFFTGNIFQYNNLGFQFFKEKKSAPRTETSSLLVPEERGLLESEIFQHIFYTIDKFGLLRKLKETL